MGFLCFFEFAENLLCAILHMPPAANHDVADAIVIVEYDQVGHPSFTDTATVMQPEQRGGVAGKRRQGKIEGDTGVQHNLQCRELTGGSADIHM